ncbi:MAG TPA: phosphatase [Clostridiaceae bacterium]|nr:phosphatase [Clostridiaceae bacterium]
MIDLHCHSDYSDGSMSVYELLKNAKENGVTHIAITDHDTSAGVEEALKIGHKFNIDVIPAIEISAYDFKRDRKVHMLGYYIKPGHQAIKRLCDPVLKQRNDAALKMFDIIISNGYKISWDDVQKYAGRTAIYKQNIMHALMDKGYCDSIYGDLFRALFSNGRNGRGKGIAYIPIRYVDMFEAIHAILDAGGVPVLAHPYFYKNLDAVPELVKEGLAGIEVKHPHHDLEGERRTREIAKKYKLIETGGTDFHGFYSRPGLMIGSSSPDIKSIHMLKDFAEKQKR